LKIFLKDFDFMKFPRTLIKPNKKAYPDYKIFSFHQMYIRHKPGYGWDENEDIPDYSTIEIANNQSMNWSAWSIPAWTRFDNLKTYKKNYEGDSTTDGFKSIHFHASSN